MNLRRKLQRSASGANGTKGLRSQVQRVLVETQKAAELLNGAELHRLSEVIRGLEEQTARADKLATALADDYESLLTEIEIQREVTLRLLVALAPTPTHQSWQELETATRKQVLEQRENQDAESVGTEEA